MRKEEFKLLNSKMSCLLNYLVTDMTSKEYQNLYFKIRKDELHLLYGDLLTDITQLKQYVEDNQQYGVLRVYPVLEAVRSAFAFTSEAHSFALTRYLEEHYHIFEGFSINDLFPNGFNEEIPELDEITKYACDYLETIFKKED